VPLEEKLVQFRGEFSPQYRGRWLGQAGGNENMVRGERAVLRPKPA